MRVRYFVTGATGFIGRHLVELLLERGGTVHALVRKGSLARLDELRDGWGVDDDRVVGVVGDLGEPFLGVDEEPAAALYCRVDHCERFMRFSWRTRSGRVDFTTRVRSRLRVATPACSARTCSRRRAASAIPTSRPSTSPRRW
jgi:nucleoside-diphosphate-sugar epimerase